MEKPISKKIMGLFLPTLIVMSILLSFKLCRRWLSVEQYSLIMTFPDNTNYIDTIGACLILSENGDSYVADKSGQQIFRLGQFQHIWNQSGLLVCREADGKKQYLSLLNSPVDTAPWGLKEYFLMPENKGSLFPQSSSEGYGYVNGQGIWCIEPQFYFAGPFFGDTAYINAKMEMHHRLIHVDTSMEVVAAADVVKTDGVFSGGFLLVKCRGVSGGQLAAFISSENRLLIPQFDATIQDAKPFLEGVAAIKVSGKWGYMDTAGELKISPQFQEAWPFCEGAAIVMDFDGSHKLIDLDGTEIKQLQNFSGHQYTGEFHDDLFVLRSPQGINLCTSDGRCMFDTNYGYYKWVDPVWVVGTDLAERVYCYFPQSGKMIRSYDFITADNCFQNVIRIDSALYNIHSGEKVFETEFLGDFCEGLALAKNSRGLYGYINADGEWVISPQFSEATAFQSGVAFVKRKDATGFIANPLIYGESWTSDECERAGIFEISYPADQEITTALFRKGLPACFSEIWADQTIFPSLEDDHTITRKDVFLFLQETAEKCQENVRYFRPPMCVEGKYDKEYEEAVAYLNSIGILTSDDVGEPEKRITGAELNVFFLRYIEASMLDELIFLG